MTEWYAIEITSFWTIFLMGLSTYITRVAGLLVLRYLSLGGLMEETLKAVPPAIFMSIIAPVAFMSGVAETLAAAITAVVAMRFSMLPSICVGVFSCAMLRMVL